MKTHSLFGLVAVVAASTGLSGCASLFEEDAPVESTEIVSADISYDDQVIESLDLFRAIEGVGQTPGDQMPTSGFATYSGVVGFSNEAPPASAADYDMMSDLSLRADFGTGGMTGVMDNFNTVGDGQMNGTLTLTEGAITGSSFTANAIGSFTDGTSAEVWDLEIAADFIGAGGSAVVGTANGTISNGGSVTSNVFGALVADRN